MKETNQYLFSKSKKGFLTMFSAVAIISSAAGSNLVNAQTIDNERIVFSEDLNWMKSQASLNGDNITIDFSQRFSSYLNGGSFHIESISSNNVVTLSVNDLSLNLAVKGFGEAVIKVTATDKEGKSITDEFKLKISKKGDINGDGIINPADVLQIYQVTTGKLTLTNELLKVLDINGDGQVTNADANELMTKYVGKKPSNTLDQNYLVLLSESNDAPIANSDKYSVQEDTAFTVNEENSLLANDTDVEGDSLSVIKMSDPTHGSLTLNDDGTFTYVPEVNFNGTDSFTYKINDGKAESEVKTVTFDVQAVNDAPVAKASSLDVTEDAEANGTLSAEDVEGEEMTYTLVEDGKKGSVTITDTKTGAYVYKPNANATGKDTFTFKVNGGTADSEVVTVEVNIEAVNDVPTGNDDSFTVQEDTTLTVNAESSILSNDTDVEGDSLSVIKTGDTAHGTLTLNTDGTFTYVPEANFNGKDQFSYKISDGQADSEEVTVTIDVQSVNDAPKASASNLEVTEDENATGTLSGTDVEDDELTYSLVGIGQKGSVQITNVKTGAYIYTPEANATGKDSFTFKVNDGTNDSEVVTVEVTIKAVNDAPTGNGDSFTVEEDTTLTVDASILSNDTDVEGDSLTVIKTSDTVHGVLTLNTDGTFTYVPEANYNGKDQFSYKINDGQADSEEVTVSIDVQSVNDVPKASANNLEVTEDENATGTLSGTDVEGDELTYILVEDGQKGSVTITNSKTGAYTYKSKANENGKDTFKFKVNDGKDDSEIVTVEVNILAVNDAPVVSGLAIEGNAKVGETLKASYTFSDAENDQEGASTYQWYKGTKEDGSDKVVIADAITKDYVITEADEGFYLFFEVTPLAVSGTQTNSASLSETSNKVAGLKVELTLSPDPYRADPTVPITEAELKGQLGGAVVLNIANDQFKVDITKDDFVLNNAPIGLTILDVLNMGDSVWLFLDYNGTDFDVNFTDVSVTAKATATLKGKEITSNAIEIKASADSITPFISEYLHSGLGRAAIEVFIPDMNSGAQVTGVEMEVHQWNLSTSQKRVLRLPFLAASPNMTYHIIDLMFYDAFDIMNIWYYNDEMELTGNQLVNNAIVLKKDGKVVDVVGDPFYNGPKAMIPNGGTLVRKSGFKDGTGQFHDSQWNVYPVHTYQFYGRYE